MKVISIIPARGGSKGLPKKNILPLQNKPLLAHTVLASTESMYITDTIVSSDDPSILSTGEKYGAKPILRPDELATDTATSDSVIEHIIDVEGIKDEDTIVLLQPTSPLRNSMHIDEAYNLYKKNGYPVFSMKKASECVFKGFTLKDGKAQGYFGKDHPFSRRQDHPELIFANGAIYIFSCGDFKKENKIPRINIIPYLMSERHSIDIDNKADLELAEHYLSSPLDNPS